jgi:hypothetical protein
MLREVGIYNLLGLFDLIDLTEVTVNRLPLIGRQRLSRQPLLSADTREVAMRTWRDQMRVQDRLDQILESHPLPHKLHSPGDLSSQRQSLYVRHPDLRQEAARLELCQNRSIARIGLDLCMSDRPHLLRIGDHDAVDMRRQQISDGRRIAGCLDYRMVVMGEFFPRKVFQCFPQHRDSTKLLERPFL